MKHLSTIRKMLEEGAVSEAKGALENLLELGPNNLEALKIKAEIFASEGRFKDEEVVWHRILGASPEDEDGIEYIQQRQIDFYFIDDLAGGARRFLAYPRSLVKISLLGLIGCITFLLITKLSEQRGMVLHPALIFTSFSVLVVLPWIGIIWSWARSLRSIITTREGVEIGTRFRNINLKWGELKSIVLLHAANPNNPDLKLLFEPEGTMEKPIMVDLNEDTSAIRARSFLVNELLSYYPKLAFMCESELDTSSWRVRSF